MPMAAIAVAMVLAVYMPPQAPSPGQAVATMSARSASVMRPDRNSPYAWNADTMSTRAPEARVQPARMVPPYTMMAGTPARAAPITTPGMFLSHPGMRMAPSYHCARSTVSTESAIKSREGSE